MKLNETKQSVGLVSFHSISNIDRSIMTFEMNNSWLNLTNQSVLNENEERFNFKSTNEGTTTIVRDPSDLFFFSIEQIFSIEKANDSFGKILCYLSAVLFSLI